MKKGNKFGEKVFWQNLGALQIVECEEEQTITTTIYKPISKLKQRLYKALSNWVLFVSVAFSLLTMKILIESMLGLK